MLWTIAKRVVRLVNVMESESRVARAGCGRRMRNLALQTLLRERLDPSRPGQGQPDRSRAGLERQWDQAAEERVGHPQHGDVGRPQAGAVEQGVGGGRR